jgi:hypothetical protein
MPLVPIQLPPGLERNGTPYETPGKWWDMSLMRWQSGSTRPVGGWQRLTPVAIDSPARKFFTWRDNENATVVLVGTDNKLWVDYGGYIDITPTTLVPPFVPPLPSLAGGYGTGLYSTDLYSVPRAPSTAFSNEANTLWSMDNFGEDVFMVASSDGRLLRYVRQTPDQPPIIQAGAPIGNTAVVVTDERYVMVIGTTSNAGPDLGTFYPRRIAWCNQEDPSDWDYASLTNTAGFLDLNATSPLFRGVRVLGGTLVFSATDVFLVQYVGTPYVYNAQKVGEAEHLHPYTVATWDGKAMWWTSRGFQMFAGGYVQPAACPIFDDLSNDFDPTWGPIRAHSSHNGAYPEVWFFYPSIGHTECNRYAAYNYLENHWMWGALDRTAMVSAGATARPLMGGIDSHIYDHESGWTAAGLPILGGRFLETGALGVGDGSNLVEVRQAMLATSKAASDPTPVDITFFGRFTPDGAERTFGPYVPRANGYTDTRVNVREGRVRYTARVDAEFALGVLRLDVAPGGTR